MPLDKNQIEPLADENYDTWVIDARAKLRQNKLWTATQTPLAANASAAMKEKHIDAADILMPILSKYVKVKLTEDEQNDGYLLWEKLKALYTPAKDQLFYTSARELFSLKLDTFDGNLEEFITRIKVLNEKIDSTKMEFTTDHRTLLVLMLGLGTPYDTLIQIWNTMPDGITGEKAIRMLRSEDKRMLDRQQGISGLLATRGVKRKAGGELTPGESSKRPSTWPTCPKCQRQHPGLCWAEMICNFCGRKGHPDYRCHDRDQGNQGERKNQTASLLAITGRSFTPAFDIGE